jgi:hypothetical protein
MHMAFLLACSAGISTALAPALQLRSQPGNMVTVEGSNPGLCYQARREVAVNFTTD